MVAIVSAALRRKGVLLIVPMIYAVATVGLLGLWDLESVRVGVAVFRRSPPGAVYRSPQVFKKLWPSILADVNHSNAVSF